jgi:hypothetical protein
MPIRQERQPEAVFWDRHPSLIHLVSGASEAIMSTAVATMVAGPKKKETIYEDTTATIPETMLTSTRRRFKVVKPLPTGVFTGDVFKNKSQQ